jgi:lipoprotein-anchoring transpeptidase ErfK/SrfK
MRTTRIVLAVFLLAIPACDRGDDPERHGTSGQGHAAAEERRRTATAIASGRAELSPEELESGRLDPSWRRYAQSDGVLPSEAGRSSQRRSPAADESWDAISPERVNGPPALPVAGDVQGPSVARIQILLAQARFSPGIIDGRWGKNTEKAVYWFQHANDLAATGEVDQATMDALTRRGRAEQARSYRLSERDVAGPFVAVPADIYERAELECLCYESLREKLGEVFQSSPELLEQLNPGVDLDALVAGDFLNVPAVERFHVGDLPEGRYTGGGEVRRIVVSVGGHYLHALDEAGNILYHFPSTLGADYAPSPTGEHVVESITFNPDWHYQPDLLPDVDPADPDAVIPAGPNNDVGVVWMALSKPHYGIHGTRAPETIGYATSAGCVRLTNWDAAFLARRVPEGVPVEFVHVDRRDARGAAAGSSTAF